MMITVSLGDFAELTAEPIPSPPRNREQSSPAGVLVDLDRRVHVGDM